mmetsp:Transcript_28278/g.84670  ORF Transcript_28278/g.84670 Transcript_28278/m.84670 type:complete len:245 (+) Transcript_28278:269-1003(+)
MVFTADGAFGLEVMFGDSKCEELPAPPDGSGAPAADAWVLANLFVQGVSYNMETEESDPFGETFKQSWPVTPYRLRIQNTTPTLRWFQLYVDGKLAYGATLKPNSTRIVEGMQARPGHGGSAVKELLFARPRLVRPDEDAHAPVDPAQVAEFESIKLTVHPTTKGEKSKKRKLGATGGYDGVNKAACKKAKAGAMTRTGEELLPANSRKSQHYNTDKSTTVASLRIRYAQRDRLEKLGVVKEEG